MPGITEEMVFTHTINSTALGTITSSTTHHTGYVVSLKLQANDVVSFSEGSSATPISLCGHKAPVTWCGA